MVPFRVSVFTVDIQGTVKGEDYDNSGSLVVYVVQDPNSKDVVFPWTPNAEILIGSYNGNIAKVAFEADENTKYSKLIMSAPGAADGRGTAAFKVEGTTKGGKSLVTDFNGPYQAYFKIDLDAAGARNAVNLKSVKTAVKVSNIANLKR